MVAKVPVGIIGCGNISPAYIKGCRMFEILDLVAVADIDMSRAQNRAAEHNVPVACTVEELLANPDIKIVINLTTPKAHTAVNLAAIAAGKNVHCEKPLAVDRKDGAKVLAAAKEKGVLVGCAPDTFFGAGIQTSRKLIDDGWIGTPVAATAFMTCHGHEGWHPDPEFYYEVGGGPMLDMGPYYLTALVNLMGSISRVTGSARITFPERVIGSQPKRGKRIPVEAATHVAGVMDFASGAVGTIITTFDVWFANLPRIEIYGHHDLRCLVRQLAAHRDLRQRRLARRPRSEHLRRRGEGAPGGRAGVERYPVDVPLRGEQPQHRGGRHGLRADHWPAASRQRRPGLPRARCDAGLRRRLERRQTHRDHQRRAATCGVAVGAAPRDAGRMRRKT